MKLHELQTELTSALRQPWSDQQILQQIESTAGLDAKARLAIYRDSMTQSLVNTLAELFPVCQKLVGTEFFTAMAALFIKQTPSFSPDLGCYGANLPDFIKDFPPATDLVYLADVAHLELAWHIAFTGHGATQLESPYPIDKIWASNQDDFEGEDRVDLNQGAVQLLVWLENAEVCIKRLTPYEWQILQEDHI